MKTKNLFNTVISIFVIFGVLVGGIAILNHINKSSFEVLDPPDDSSEASFKTLCKWDFSEELNIEYVDSNSVSDDLLIIINYGDYEHSDGFFNLICGENTSNSVHFGYNNKTFLTDFSYYTIDMDITLPSLSGDIYLSPEFYNNDGSISCERGPITFRDGILYDNMESELGSYNSNKSHLTYIISSDNTALLYLNGEYIASISDVYSDGTAYIEGFTFVVNVFYQDSYIIDNVELRSYDAGYTGPLSDLFDSHADLSTCPDSVLFEG